MVWSGQCKADVIVTCPDLVVSSELANSLTTQVHEGDWLCQYDLLPCNSSTCLKCLVLSFVERHSKFSGKGVQHQETNLQKIKQWVKQHK